MERYKCLWKLFKLWLESGKEYHELQFYEGNSDIDKIRYEDFSEILEQMYYFEDCATENLIYILKQNGGKDETN